MDALKFIGYKGWEFLNEQGLKTFVSESRRLEIASQARLNLKIFPR